MVIYPVIIISRGEGEKGAEARENRRRGIREAWEEREEGGDSKSAGNERNRGNYATMLNISQSKRANGR